MDWVADVYFHEAQDPGWYYCHIESDHVQLEELLEDLEGQLGEPYERAVDPGESVYVGQLKYELDDDGELDDWVFNRILPSELDAELDGESYEEEGGVV